MKAAKLPSPGPRMIKTAIAVTLAVAVARLYSDSANAAFYAAFGALISMETTFSKSLRQGLVQLIGVLSGTLIGYCSLLLFPEATPSWLIGIGVLLLILICNAMRWNFSASLSCIIFLSACLLPTENSILLDSALRLRDTAVGLGIALIVNITIRPYNNRSRILSLLRRLMAQIPKDLESMVVHERFPDLQPNVELLRRMDRELELYHSQRFIRRKTGEEAMLQGCRRLADRILLELEAICGMDSLGDLSPANEEPLRKLGLAIPEQGIHPRKCTSQDTAVMNYHLENFLRAYKYLGELMELFS